MKFITMICPMHEEKTPSFMYNKKTGDFYCFGCGAQGNLFTLHQKRILSEDVLDYIYSHIQHYGDALQAVEFCIDCNPMLCHDCWIPALLDRGKKIQCQNCGCEWEQDSPSEVSHKVFRKWVGKKFGDRLKPFSKSL